MTSTNNKGKWKAMTLLYQFRKESKNRYKCIVESKDPIYKFRKESKIR